jgi:3-carboxy-cis,cis-muconate cycloisomerase
MTSASLARLAREVIDLSRTEIAELNESEGPHRGASSTMPQKRNPIASEGVLGLALDAIGNASMMLRASEVGHERAAGEWQLEWKVLPEALRSTATALLYTQRLLLGLVVNEEAMARNLEADYGLILSEEYMVILARSLGRERAHEIVYKAAGISRDQRIPLHDALLKIDSSIRDHFESWPLLTGASIGQSAWICERARSQWDEARTEVKQPTTPSPSETGE